MIFLLDWRVTNGWWVFLVSLFALLSPLMDPLVYSSYTGGLPLGLFLIYIYIYIYIAFTHQKKKIAWTYPHNKS